MKILLSIDSSEPAQTAIDETIAASWPPGSSFQVVTVLHNPFGSAVDKKAGEYAQELLDKAVAKIKSAIPQATSVEGQVLRGYPQAEVHRQAEESKPDLLVVGSRGRKGLSRVLLGSVSHALLVSVPCSIRIARSSNGREKSLPPRILLSLDDSKFSDTVVEHTMALPWPDGTEFLCATAIPTLTQYLHESQNCHQIEQLETSRADQLETATARLEQVCAQLRKRLPGKSVSATIVDGDPRESIVDAAKSWSASLVLIGCKGKNWIDRIFVGSVSEAVATWADCSVEVVKN